MDIIDECDETNWQDREKYWIKIYKDLGYDLTNSSVGGKGGLSPSEETREKMSIAKLGKPIRLDIMQKTLAKGWGRKKTEEERCKISSSQIGRIFSQETKQKMVNAWKLRKLRNVK